MNTALLTLSFLAPLVVSRPLPDPRPDHAPGHAAGHAADHAPDPAAHPSAGQGTLAKRTLSLDGARLALEAAEAYAREHGAGGAIAVVDDGGNLVAFARLDGTFPAGAGVSVGKARTAALFQRPTAFFEEAIVEKGRVSMTALPDFTPLQGGVPIVVDGHVVGAVGVSGATSAQQDAEIATMAAKAVSDRETRVGQGQDVQPARGTRGA